MALDEAVRVALPVGGVEGTAEDHGLVPVDAPHGGDRLDVDVVAGGAELDRQRLGDLARGAQLGRVRDEHSSHDSSLCGRWTMETRADARPSCPTRAPRVPAHRRAVYDAPAASRPVPDGHPSATRCRREDQVTEIQLTETQQAAIRALMRDEGAIPAAAPSGPRPRRLPNDVVERDRAQRDPDGFWAEQAAAVDWIEPWTQVSEITPARSRVVPRRHAQRVRQLPRPPRPRRAAQHGGPHLDRRGRRGAHVHVRAPLSRGQSLRECAPPPRRREGRPGRRLHAARPRGDHHDARVRPDRRRAQRGVRGDGHPGALVPDRGLGRARRRVQRLHVPPRQEDPAQAHGGRGRPRQRPGRVGHRPSPGITARRRSR